MRNERAANQRRSLRNRRNRQPTTPPNPNRVPIRYQPKLKYQNSTRRADGVLILSSRKRAAPTAEEKKRRKQRKIQIKTAQVAKSSLQHKVINLYEHGAYFDAWQFPAKSSRSIIQFLQKTYPEKYGKFALRKDFFIERSQLQNGWQIPRILTLFVNAEEKIKKRRNEKIQPSLNFATSGSVNQNKLLQKLNQVWLDMVSTFHFQRFIGSPPT